MRCLVIITLALMASPVWGAITFVGSTSSSVPSGSGTTSVSLPTVLEDDFVLVLAVSDDDTSGDGIDGGEGYTDIYHTGSTPGRHYAYKFMGATPDTTVLFNQDSNRDQAVLIVAYRGVDLTTPLDIAVASLSGNNDNPNSPVVTTVSDGAWVLTFSAMDDDSPQTISSVPTGYSNEFIADTDNETSGQGASSAVASKEVATAGSEDPAEWTMGSSDQWKAATLVLRPASGGGGGRARRMF